MILCRKENKNGKRKEEKLRYQTKIQVDGDQSKNTVGFCTQSEKKKIVFFFWVRGDGLIHLISKCQCHNHIKCECGRSQDEHGYDS